MQCETNGRSGRGSIMRTVIVALVFVALAVPAGAQAATRITVVDEPFSRVLIGGTTGPDQMELSGIVVPSGTEYAVRDPGSVLIDFGTSPFVGCDQIDPNYVRCLEITPSVSGQQVDISPGGGDDQVSLDFPTRNLAGPIYFPDVRLTNTSGADRITSVGPSNDQITTDQGSVAAGPGNDVLAGKGATLAGEAGNDSISLAGSTAPASVSGGPGADTIDTRNGFADTISCGPDADSVQFDALDRADADCEIPPAGSGLGQPVAAKARFKGALKVAKLPKSTRRSSAALRSAWPARSRHRREPRSTSRRSWPRGLACNARWRPAA